MAKGCTHVAGIRDVTPSALGCEECLQSGSEWLHLRICRSCGHVGCCDDSPNKHATSTFPRHRASHHRGLRSAGGMGLVLRRRSRVRPVEPQDAAQRSDPALLLKFSPARNLLQRPGKRCGQNRIAAEALKTHARRSRDFTYALGPNGGQATAKRRQQSRFFSLISIKLKHLHVMFANLSGLRQRCDEPGAKWRHRLSQLKRHAAASGFCAAARWQGTGSRC